ncbi:hypothetical protein EAH89_17465 [Roseomonas nepalensis]|uniref:Uncharacterized protein n=1 Tax=Muricoccus nepalensis TaxID=1854500 RepID=A0A502FUP0_9PROT|nr:hypothetical protein [Roseomonas nepalensis]TPG53109.1 hypothetical protein EAH89_17465 [Roseomonas nepalensis]
MNDVGGVDPEATLDSEMERIREDIVRIGALYDLVSRLETPHAEDLDRIATMAAEAARALRSVEGAAANRRRTRFSSIMLSFPQLNLPAMFDPAVLDDDDLD